MVLSNPITLVASSFAGARKIDRLLQRLRAGATFADGGLIESAEGYYEAVLIYGCV